ncbi:MAG TPA: 5-carboxymethyl-2-hydroxymuconate Delta-isomerase [Hyphomicrobiales bacterium]|nr:5-carboxymethyl-2-hydroxymuconate Delta-isomerase [Hyphomicrobiales bacterium]
MPHIVVEYSTNLEEHVAIQEMIDAVHAVALASGVADLPAIRVRAAPRPFYRIADGNPKHMFIHATIRLRIGRSEAAREALGKGVLAAIETTLGAVLERETIGITVEVHEITEMTFRRNTIRERTREKT